MKDVQDTTLICAPVPPDHVNDMWCRVLPHLQRAEKTSNGRMNIEDLRESACRGVHLIWLIFDTDTNEVIAAFTTRVVHYPQLRALLIEWVGGNHMAKWFGIAHDHIKEHAKINNCTRLEATGRNAWIRWVGRVGWEPEFVQYTLEV